MATTLTELRSGRSGTRSRGRKRTYVRRFRLTTDGVVDQVIDARTYPGVPQILSPHPTDSTAFCHQIDVAQPFEDKQIWDIACQYTNVDIDIQAGNESGFATERPKVSWTSVKYSTPAETAYYIGGTPPPNPLLTGKLIVPTNSRKQPFNPPLERDQTRKVLVIQRRESGYSPDTAGMYEDAINSAPITIANKNFAKHTGKVETITADDAYESGVHYWLVRYEIHYRRETWNPTIIDAAIDDSGRRILLDGNGNEMTPAALNQGQLPGQAIYRIYDERDFTMLGLPATV